MQARESIVIVMSRYNEGSYWIEVTACMCAQFDSRSPYLPFLFVMLAAWRHFYDAVMVLWPISGVHF